MKSVSAVAFQGTPDAFDLIEFTGYRLREAHAILQVIDAGKLLAELPLGRLSRKRHQAAVSMLEVMDRELIAVIDTLD